MEDFEQRLTQMDKSRDTPPKEIDTAVMVFERLKTAKAICTSVFGITAQEASVVAVFQALSNYQSDANS